MAKLKIPEMYYEGFKVILSLSDKQINLLIREHENVETQNEIIELIKKKIDISEKASADLVSVLMSLLGLADGKKTDQVANDLIAGLKNTKILTTKTDLNKVKEMFEKLLLNKGTIGLALKALSLKMEVQNYLVSSRIISDIRTAFEPEIEKNIKAATIIHNLKLVYHVGSRHEEIYISLDRNDLINLKEQILRAEQKEQSIKNTLAKVIHFTEIKA